jgi:hypothetical protein
MYGEAPALQSIYMSYIKGLPSLINTSRILHADIITGPNGEPISNESVERMEC